MSKVHFLVSNCLTYSAEYFVPSKCRTVRLAVKRRGSRMYVAEGQIVSTDVGVHASEDDISLSQSDRIVLTLVTQNGLDLGYL
jgi:hypothetical protein